MSNTITIAEVAAKLGLHENFDGDFQGVNPFTKTGAEKFVLFGTSDDDIQTRGEAWDIVTHASYSAREVFALAGYPRRGLRALRGPRA